MRQRKQRATLPDPESFIRTNTRLAPLATLPEIRLHGAHQATGLWQLADDECSPSAPMAQI